MSPPNDARFRDLVEGRGIAADADLLQRCRDFLAHPWVGIIEELQFGSRYESSPPTIQDWVLVLEAA